MGNILVIEDNRDVLENTVELLKLANYNVFEASNGKQGLELAGKCDPDLILCDVMMPELDGFGVLRALGNITSLKGTSFVFVTAKTDMNDYRNGMDLGADDYLFKPYSGDELLSTVAARVKKAQELKGLFKQANYVPLLNIPDDASENYFTAFIDKLTSKQPRKKEVLFIEEEDSNYFFYVLKGRIKTYKTCESGKEYITNIYTPGDFFGYNTMVEHSRHTESAEAIENSEIGYISKNQFIKILELNPTLSTKFINFLSKALCEAKGNLIKLAYNSARKRISEAVLFIARKYNNGTEFQFPMNRNDISAISGISPESVSRNLTDFRNEGLIDIENGILKILNWKKLETLKN